MESSILPVPLNESEDDADIQMGGGIDYAMFMHHNSFLGTLRAHKNATIYI